MKVLLTSTDNPYITKLGGKHIHLMLLERGLKELGAQVSTLYYDASNVGELAKKAALQFFSEKQRYEHRIKWIENFLVKHAPRNDFDIIHAHDVLSMLAIANKPQKKVLTLHGYFARENVEFIKNESKRSEVYPFLLNTERNGMKNADYIITVDQRLKNYATSEFNYPEEKVTVIHNAVDTLNFKPASKEEQTKLKEEAGFSQNDFIVLVPRRLVEKNGVIYATRAMKHVKNNNVKMIIAGDGPERAKILEEIDGDPRIHFKGIIPHDKISAYYMMADAVLIPSITAHGIQEASSLAMLEGMACGKVVICSEVGGMREIVQNMKNGILMKEKEPALIAKNIETLIENPEIASRLAHNAREYVLQNHSYLTHAQKIFNIYRDILEEASPSKGRELDD